MAQKKKIVMIDDEPDLCRMVKENLEATGEFVVSTTTQPEEAFSFCQKEKPDLILLDLVMPKIRGDKINKMIKRDPQLKQVPVLIITGLGEMTYLKKKDKWRWLPNRPVVKERGDIIQEHDAARAAKAYGVEGYIVKPFTTQMLVEVIKEALARKEKSQAYKEKSQSVEEETKGFFG